MADVGMEICENTYKRTRTRAQTHITSLIPAGEDQFEWHKTSRVTGPECAVMCYLTHTHRAGLCGYVQFNLYTHTQMRET